MWRQRVQPAFHVDSASLRVSATSISARVIGPRDSYLVTFVLNSEAPHGFDLGLEIPGRRYTLLPDWPFPFTASGKNWSYVQNTSGEGMLMPVDKPADILNSMAGAGGSRGGGSPICAAPCP